AERLVAQVVDQEALAGGSGRGRALAGTGADPDAVDRRHLVVDADLLRIVAVVVLPAGELLLTVRRFDLGAVDRDLRRVVVLAVDELELDAQLVRPRAVEVVGDL